MELILSGIVGILVIWLIIVEWRLFALRKTQREIMKVAKKHDLAALLEEILRNYAEWNERKDQFETFMKSTKASLDHTLRDVGFVRYDSFEGVGGQQSFSMLFLTPQLDGVIISALHDRVGTKMYAKRVIQGEPQHNLSKEESELLSSVLD